MLRTCASAACADAPRSIRHRTSLVHSLGAAFGVTLFEAMSLQQPWMQLDDGFGGIEGGLKGLYKCVSTQVTSSRVPNSGGKALETTGRDVTCVTS